MSVNFSEPQRQSAAGIITSVLYAMQQIVRAVIVPLVILVVKSNKEVLVYTSIGFLFLVLIAVVYGYFHYLNFTFYLNTAKQEFVINKGVFGRQHLTIPVEKIQQVNINQGFLQKLIGVYSLQIDTAGSDSKEVSISAISGQIAYALKEHLLNGDTKQTIAAQHNLTHQGFEAQEIPFLKISAATLLKIGLTSNYGRSFILLLGFGYAVFHNIKEFLKAFDNDHGQVEQFFKSGFTLISISVLFIGIIAILLATNVIRTLVKYFDFQISRQERSLLISSGFLAKKNTLLHPNKVQVTEYSQNYLQKKIGLFNMALKQAKAGQEQSESEIKRNNMEIPGCSPLEKDEVLRVILGKIPQGGTRYAPNFRFMNLPFFFIVLLPIAAYLISFQFIPETIAFYPLAIIYVLAVSLMIYIAYTKHRITVSEDFIIKQSGIWDISQEIIEPHKIQSISTSQYPWHKSLDIGHVTLHTAAGNISFSYGNYTEIKTLVNWWLYQIESRDKDWM